MDKAIQNLCMFWIAFLFVKQRFYKGAVSDKNLNLILDLVI